MKIDFATTAGSRFTLDHATKTFVQHYPKKRKGQFYNAPAVRLGDSVEILTHNPGPKPLLAIITSPVKSRVVHLA